MYLLRACIHSCALCADLLEVGCELALQLREMRIYIRQMSSENPPLRRTSELQTQTATKTAN